MSDAAPSGAEAVEWGLAVESPPADELDELDELDERTDVLVQRIAAMPVNQLMMVKLALNSVLMAQGVHQSQLISTVFDGISRHTREGYAQVVPPMGDACCAPPQHAPRCVVVSRRGSATAPSSALRCTHWGGARDGAAHGRNHCAQRTADVGFRQAVRERDAAPYDDHGPSTNKG